MSIDINNVAVRDPRSAPQTSERSSQRTPDTSEPEASPTRGESVASETTQDESVNNRAAGLSSEELVELAGDASKQFRALGRELEFEVAEQSGRTVITVLDRASGDVIRSIPPEKLLQVSEYLNGLDGSRGRSGGAELTGVLLSEKVVA